MLPINRLRKILVLKTEFWDKTIRIEHVDFFKPTIQDWQPEDTASHRRDWPRPESRSAGERLGCTEISILIFSRKSFFRIDLIGLKNVLEGDSRSRDDEQSEDQQMDD